MHFAHQRLSPNGLSIGRTGKVQSNGDRVNLAILKGPAAATLQIQPNRQDSGGQGEIVGVF
ncbi:MAG: hypothetical protein IT427_04985 [Pirellulales bacterium]|nr:hypothetical protein [Pirellulales bacterium]